MRITPRANTSAFARGYSISEAYNSGAMQFAVHDSLPLKNFDALANSFGSKGVAYPKSIILTELRSELIIIFHGLRSLWQ